VQYFLHPLNKFISQGLRAAQYFLHPLNKFISQGLRAAQFP
jgi:hypothetical protein